jgi:hypothetical protein
LSLMEVRLLVNSALAKDEDKYTAERIQEFIDTGNIGDCKNDRVIPFNPEMYAALAREFESGK